MSIVGKLEGLLLLKGDPVSRMTGYTYPYFKWEEVTVHADAVAIYFEDRLLKIIPFKPVFCVDADFNVQVHITD